MASSATIANAYVQIMPSADGMEGKLAAVMDPAATKAGASSGKKLTNALGGTLKTGAKVVGAGLVAATAGSAAFAKSAIEAGAAFDSAMSQVAATGGKTMAELEADVHSTSTAYGDFTGNLNEYAQFLGSNTAFSATQAAEALNYMALAGYDAQQSMDVLPSVLNLAAAGGIDLAYASDMVTDASSALGLSLDETYTLVDQMATASANSNTSVAQLGEAILTVGGTAKNLAGGTTELSTALGILADNGIKGAEGGTALRNIILSLSAPTDQAATLMAELGLEVFDAEGNMRPLNETFEDLNGILGGMTQQQQTEVLNTLFNKVDLKSANALLANSGDRFDELSAAIDNCSGAAQAMADTQLDNLEGDMTLLKSAIEGAQIAVSDALAPSLRGLVQEGTNIVSDLTAGFKEGGLQGALEVAGSKVGDLGNTIGSALGSIDWDTLTSDITGGIQSFFDGIQESDFDFATFASGLLTAIGSGLSTLVDCGMDLITGGKWSEWINSISDDAGNVDFGLFADSVISGIGEAIGGLVDDGLDLITGGQWANWKTDIENFEFPDIGAAVSDVWEGVSNTAGEAWSGITTNLGTVWDNIGTEADTAFTGIGTSIDAFVGDAQAAFDEWGIDVDVQGTWDSIKTFIDDPIGTLSESIDGFVSDASAAFSNWDIDATVQGVWNNVQSFIGDPIGTTSTAIAGFVSDAKAAFDEWGISDAASTAWAAVRTAIDDPIGTLGPSISNFASDVDSTFASWGIETNVSAAWSAVQSAIEDPIGTLGPSISSFASDVDSTFASWGIETHVGDVWGAIQTAIEDPIGTLGPTINDFAVNVKGTLADWGIDVDVDTVWTNLKGFIDDPVGSLTSTVGDFISGVQESFDGWTIDDAVNTVWTNLQGFIDDPIGTLSSSINDFATNVRSTLSGWGIDVDVDTVWSKVQSAINDPIGTLGPGINDFVTNVQSTFQGWGIDVDVQGIWNNLQGFINDPIGSLKTNVDTFADGVKKKFDEWGIDSTVQTVFNNVEKFMKDPIGSAKDWITGESGPLALIKGAFDGIDLHFPEIKLPHITVTGGYFNDIFDWQMPTFGIDWYASGGIFDGASLIGVGEAGAEAVIPLDNRQYVRPFASAVADEIDIDSGGGIVEAIEALREDVRNIKFAIQIDPDGMARDISRALRTQARMVA